MSQSQLLLKAKIYAIKFEQSYYLKDELSFLEGKSTGCVPNTVNNLCLYLDENALIRSRGRLGKCQSLDESVNNPILLPKDSGLTKLFIWEFHLRSKHLGVGTTLTALRNAGFWVPKGRNLVKRVLQDCVPCKKLNAHAFSYPKPGDYPFEKVNFKRPYQFTGMISLAMFMSKLVMKLRRCTYLFSRA